jgi:hypothetical protein
MLKKLLVPLLIAVAFLATAAPSEANAPTTASCTGQFFSEHSGSATQGVTVGGFVSETARLLGSDFGATISGARTLPRANCGL